MRTTLLMTVAMLAASVTTGYAQIDSAQTPASPAASSQSVQPTNSLPPGAGASPGAAMPNQGMPSPATPGLRPSATAGAPNDAMGMSPDTAPGTMRMHRRAAMRPHQMRAGHAGMTRLRGGADEDMTPVDPENPGGGRAPADQYSGVPPTSAYQGGAGSPSSNRASNINSTDTHSLIAPRLPNPEAGGSTPQAYLAAADRALARGQTGAAQEALERAQTRILTRSTDPAMANMPDDSGIARAIDDARQALARSNPGRARSIIGQALNRGG